MSLLVVLLLISMTLGLSYAAMRSQNTELKILRNSGRRLSARQAAATGLTIALKNMHQGDQWDGVGSTLTGKLSDYENFQVTYTAGDPAFYVPEVVNWDEPEFDDPFFDYAYRVTLMSTGYAADPDEPSNIATYQIRAVVRLVPRQLAREPSDWETMRKYTVYQTRKDSFEVDIPCRLEGPVRIQGKLKVATHYPNDYTAMRHYLEGLNSMRINGRGDYRPFDGPVNYPYDEQDWTQQVRLQSMLGVIGNNVPLAEAAADWTKPTSLTTYQIYKGGPVYNIPSLGSTLENVVLEPDPQNNPLGIYYRPGNLSVRGNVSIRGSLFCEGDINIEGEDVALEPVRLPALSGEDTYVRLPVASCQNFSVKATAKGSLRGLLAVFNDFTIEQNPDTVSFAFVGRVIAEKLVIKEREPWKSLDWKGFREAFEWELYNPFTPTIPFFPLWLYARDARLNPKPLLTIQPDSDPLTYHYHWKYPNDLIYIRHYKTLEDPDNPNDDGLRWELVKWTENP